MVFFKPQVYSKFYESLFNNSKYSDVKIKLESSGEVINAHKSVLASSSDYFLNLFKENNEETVVINEENEKLFKEFLQFFYTGYFNCISEENTFKLVLYFNKYKVKNPKDFKISPKGVLKGAITYVEQDLEKRQSEFSDILKCINFKKIEKDELKKFQKKSKWLQKHSDWLNIVVSKNSDDEDDSDKSGSDSDSDKSDSESDSDKSESESEEEDDDEDGGYFPKSKLLKPKYQKLVHKWTKEKKKWKLIYKASKDGFSASSFHQKCDNQGPTVVIIHSNLGNIFGGYNPNDWSSNSQYGNSSNSFIFLIKAQKKDKIKKPIMMNCFNSSYSTYNYSTYGPVFGGGFDLYLCDNCNSNNSSYSNLGYSYTPPKNYIYNQNAKDLLAGSYNFTVKDYEVYKNLKKKK